VDFANDFALFEDGGPNQAFRLFAKLHVILLKHNELYFYSKLDLNFRPYK